MNSSLSSVWSKIESLLNDGFSLIAIRDKDEGEYVAKSPYNQWKQYQTRQATKEELWNAMEKNNTTAIGILGGKISGNLEIIDIDIKYKPGIDAIIFTDIKTLYPELLEKLRIHKTPSGGWHLLYRCEKEIGKSEKLAGRYATEKELANNPKTKVVNFIETRGEGGYVAAPPSLGYRVGKDVPVPVLTEHERASIIQLMRSYNEVIKVKREYKPSVHEFSYYNETPFDHFNASCDAMALAEELGWKEYKTGGNFIWFTRPGKSKGVSMSFNLSKRFYFCFTASTELEENHGYTPANLVSAILFNDDKKQLYQWLVQRGYGKVKPEKENDFIKKAVIKNTPLPANFSTTAAQQLTELKQHSDEIHPYGIFWEYNEDFDRILISRERLYVVSSALGFRNYEDQLWRIVSIFIHEQTPRMFFDAIKDYIKEEDGEIYEDICNSYEHFMQQNGKFTMERMTILDESLITKDTKHTANKFYLNGYLEITQEKIQFKDYSLLDGLVFYSRLKQRNYKYSDGGLYIDFLLLATGGITDHIKKILGFLTHEYKDSSMAYIIILTETCPDPKQGGGSGKNVFCDLLKHSTSYISKPAGQVKNFDENFFQVWGGQRVFGISDLPKDFDLTFLKEPAGGDILLKKLFKDQRIINVDKAPKFIVQTNFSYEVSDGGLKRRIIPLEFTDYFTKAGGLDVHFGKLFPDEWSDKDWNCFDSLIAESIQSWLKAGRKLTAVPLSETGWEKQFIYTYGIVIHDLICGNIDTWKELIFVSNDIFKSHLETYYVANSIASHYRPAMAKINKALDEYCNHFFIKFQKDISRRDAFNIIKGRLFETNKSEF